MVTLIAAIVCLVLGYVTARIHWRSYAAKDDAVSEEAENQVDAGSSTVKAGPSWIRRHDRVQPLVVITADEREKLRLMQATDWLKQFNTEELRNEREAALAVARLRRFAQMNTTCGCPFPHQDRLPYWHVFKRGEVWGAVATTGKGLEAPQVTWWGTWEEAIRFTARNKMVVS